MATLSGHRTAVRLAATAAALVAVALTVGASPVSAAPATPTVEFTGGSVLSLLVCKSEPSTGSVSVPADSKVNFVNRLGQDAELRVDGRSVADVPANQQVPVQFKKGPVEVAMTFECGAGVVQRFDPVSVGVTGEPAAAVPNAAKPAPTTKAPAPPNNGPAGAAAGAANGVITGKTSSPARSTKTPRAQETPGTDELGTEPADPSLLNPSATPLAGEVAPSTPVDDRVLVEPAVMASGPARSGPAGLLALVATVCVVGVGIAAIRAIIAQRSSRTSFA